jgi:hypothetical protein
MQFRTQVDLLLQQGADVFFKDALDGLHRIMLLVEVIMRKYLYLNAS